MVTPPQVRLGKERGYSMHFQKFSLLVALLLICGEATAQSVLVERLPDPSLVDGGVVGSAFSDRPGEEVSPLTTITLAEPTSIGEVTVFTTNLNDAFPSVGYPIGGTSSAVLNIFAGSTLSGSDDTLSGGDFGDDNVTVSYTATADGIEITASGLDISLAAGSYLIGITPILNFSSNGQEFFQDAGSNGATTLLNNPGGALINPIFGSATINANELDLPVTYTGMAIRVLATDDGVLKGDVNGDGLINLLDVSPFVDAISAGVYVPAADVNCDGIVNLLDVDPFITLLNG
ncbi:MAG: dockerin type I domain-containing protein [Planctomycetota bacterium]